MSDGYYYQLYNAIVSGDQAQVIRHLRYATPERINHVFRGNTALMMACMSGNVSMVRLLLSEPGIDVNVQDHNGLTALMKALGHNSNTHNTIHHSADVIVNMLLSRPELRVNLSSDDVVFKPALYYAMQPTALDMGDALSLQLRKTIVHDMLCRSGRVDFNIQVADLSPSVLIHNYSTSLTSYHASVCAAAKL